MRMQPDRVKRYPRRACDGSGTLAGTIRRNFRDASMIALTPREVVIRRYGLESVKKTPQVAGVGGRSKPADAELVDVICRTGYNRIRWVTSPVRSFRQRPDDLTPIRKCH